MSKNNLLKKGEEARQCLQRAVHDELVKKAKLGQDVIINRGGKPYRIPAAEALLIQEEGGEYKTKPSSGQ
jgi:hypothetical protein